MGNGYPAFDPNGYGHAFGNEGFEDTRFQGGTMGGFEAYSQRSALEGLDVSLPPDAEVVAVQDELRDLQQKDDDLLRRLDDLQAKNSAKETPVLDEMERIKEVRAEKLARLQFLTSPPGELPPGPQSLMWLEGAAFSAGSSAIIALNLVLMVLEMKDDEVAESLWGVDQVFMSFYVFELTAKALLHQRGLLFGPLSIVWWNWLDSVIVLSGVLDQWLVPGLKEIGVLQTGGKGGSTLSLLRALRFLRLFRIMRVLKIVKVFLQADLSWTEGASFQSFIMGVIVVNATMMSLELDINWGGWYWAEQVMLCIYFFELSVRVKKWGPRFFCHKQDWKMNNLDFVIVAGGVIEQWCMPAVRLAQTVISGEASEPNEMLKNVMSLLRMLRLLRVLRLIRLVREIKPLYRLLFGLIAACEGIQWVLLLAAIMIYAASILFTSMIGHGLVFAEGEIDPRAKDIFGTCGRSMFVLFKLMSGDSGDIEPLLDNNTIKVFFMGFTIMSNWVMLAILTAVVSDNMIAATTLAEQEDVAKQTKDGRERSLRRIVEVLEEKDPNGNGVIEETEFKLMMSDPECLAELLDATGLDESDLQDLWLFLTTDGDSGKRSAVASDLAEQLLDEGNPLVERSVYRLEKRVQNMQRLLRREIIAVRHALAEKLEGFRQNSGEPSLAHSSPEREKTAPSRAVAALARIAGLTSASSSRAAMPRSAVQSSLTPERPLSAKERALRGESRDAADRLGRRGSMSSDDGGPSMAECARFVAGASSSRAAMPRSAVQTSLAPERPLSAAKGGESREGADRSRAMALDDDDPSMAHCASQRMEVDLYSRASLARRNTFESEDAEPGFQQARLSRRGHDADADESIFEDVGTSSMELEQNRSKELGSEKGMIARTDFHRLRRASLDGDTSFKRQWT